MLSVTATSPAAVEKRSLATVLAALKAKQVYVQGQGLAAFVAKPERPYAPACGAVADLNAIETNRLAPEDIDCARCVRNFQTTRRPGEFFTEQRERVEQIIIRNFQKRGLL